MQNTHIKRNESKKRGGVSGKSQEFKYDPKLNSFVISTIQPP